MTKSPVRKIVIGLLALVANLGVSRASTAQTASSPDDATTQPVHAFIQVGSGIPEFAHAEVGVFLTSRLTLEAMAAWDGVFYSRYGGGLMYAFGHAQEGRPPRHALLVGARLMLNSTASFDSNGEDASSYVMVPVGYGYLADSGFYFRATLALVITRRERTDSPAQGLSFDGHWIAGGQVPNVAVGFAF
jgi:hypothetical protein